MPNGGPDNCSNCRFNVARQQSSGVEAQDEMRLMTTSHCSLRGVPIPNAYWTYCRDFTSCHSTEPLVPKTPTGPILSGAFYEGGVGYPRLPWLGAIAPTFNVSVECRVCGREVSRGIELRTSEGAFGFCTAAHYIDWWKQQSDDRTVESSGL